LEGLHTPKQVPEKLNIDEVNATPIQRNLQHMEKMESAFEDGYDTEEEIGPSWVATHLEPSVSRGNTTGHSPSWKRN